MLTNQTCSLTWEHPNMFSNVCIQYIACYLKQKKIFAVFYSPVL